MWSSWEKTARTTSPIPLSPLAEPCARLRSHRLALILLAGLVSGLSSTGAPRADVYENQDLRIFADLRARLESDFDSQTATGSSRDDRTRLRVRVRLGMRYDPTEYLSLGIRVRSGSDDSQQSPHITVLDFDDNDTGDSDFNLDQWFLKGDWKHGWVWIGRNSFPFWKQNELFWDDDVTPAGLAGGLRRRFGGGELSVQGGYFSLPVGMQEFAGNLGAAQAVYVTPVGKAGITAAAGVFKFAADTDDPDAATLLNGNGSRDYTIWTGSVQVRLKAKDRPLVLGLDYMHNSENYSATHPDPFTAANHDETDGYVVSAKLGSLKAKGDWLAAYYYARIETFAVNSSVSQDDWVRWGSATETRASNLKGHELRFAYAFEQKINLVARLYLVEAVTTPEDGNRFRVDLNFKF